MDDDEAGAIGVIDDEDSWMAASEHVLHDQQIGIGDRQPVAFLGALDGMAHRLATPPPKTPGNGLYGLP